MEKQRLVALLVSLYYGVFSIACAEPDSDNRNIELRNSTRAITSTAREANALFDARRAFDMLEKQCAFGPRPPGSISHQETQNFLFTELQKYANSVAFQPHQYKTKTATLHLNNILAEFGPPTGGETLLLAAHWDTRPFADRDPNPKNRDKPILGANDGASGVAVLLEIARVLKEHPPPRTVIIVLFDGEDYGRSVENMFIGSRFFARNMGKWKPDYGILLDMIGDKDLALPIERYSWNANRGFTEAIWQRAATLGLTPFQSRLGDAILDDHVPLIEVGIPMVNIIDFTYPYWHTVEDTVDKCSPKSLEVVATLVISIIYDGL
ncbi:MAG: M28 family peptidase [Candidatus Poribacteria bacterium]|nr:M28 family peptidase [Candidatus Poribacteria bacterium]